MPVDLFTEVSCNLAVTPQMSKTFNEHYEVIDVVKQKLEPSDSFEFTLHRNFSSMTSVRKLSEELDKVGHQDYGLHTVEGDYDLLIVARGKPGLYVYDVKEDYLDKASLHPRELRRTPVGGVPESKLSYVTTCEAEQISISVNTEHSMETVFNGDPDVIAKMLEHPEQIFLINPSERLLDTSSRYIPFGCSKLWLQLTFRKSWFR